MFSRPGRILALILTVTAVALVLAALASRDDLAGVAVFFIALYFVAALTVLVVTDFVITSLVRSRRAVRRAEQVNP